MKNKIIAIVIFLMLVITSILIIPTSVTADDPIEDNDKGNSDDVFSGYEFPYYPEGELQNKYIPYHFWPDPDWNFWHNWPHMFSMPPGNVGVGTSKPMAKLDVFGNIAIRGREIINEKGMWVGDPTGLIGPAPEHEWEGTELRFQNPDGSWGDYVDLEGPQGERGPQGDTGPQGPPGPIAGSDKQFVYNDNGIAEGADVYYDKTTGKVGIGTTSPNSELEVDGIIQSSNGGFKFPDGSIQTTAVTQSSQDYKILDYETVICKYDSSPQIDGYAAMVTINVTTNHVMMKWYDGYPSGTRYFSKPSNWEAWEDFGTPSTSSKIKEVDLNLNFNEYSEDTIASLTVILDSGELYFRQYEGGRYIYKPNTWGNWISFGII